MASRADPARRISCFSSQGAVLGDSLLSELEQTSSPNSTVWWAGVSASGGYGNHIRGSGRDTGDFTIDAWLNESNGAISDRAFADRARTTAAALEAIARLPGRENLIRSEEHT